MKTLLNSIAILSLAFTLSSCEKKDKSPANEASPPAVTSTDSSTKDSAPAANTNNVEPAANTTNVEPAAKETPVENNTVSNAAPSSTSTNSDNTNATIENDKK